MMNKALLKRLEKLAPQTQPELLFDEHDIRLLGSIERGELISVLERFLKTEVSLDQLMAHPEIQEARRRILLRKSYSGLWIGYGSRYAISSLKTSWSYEDDLATLRGAMAGQWESKGLKGLDLSSCAVREIKILHDLANFSGCLTPNAPLASFERAGEYSDREILDAVGKVLLDNRQLTLADLDLSLAERAVAA